MLSIIKYCANSIDLQLILRYIGKVLTSTNVKAPNPKCEFNFCIFSSIYYTAVLVTELVHTCTPNQLICIDLNLKKIFTQKNFNLLESFWDDPYI